MLNINPLYSRNLKEITIIPLRPSKLTLFQAVTFIFHIPRGYNKYAEDTTSRDSDSLIQEYGNLPTEETNTYCWRHPKVRENWRTVLAAFTLLVVGTGLFVMGTFAIADPQNTSQGVVFFVAGLICFIPGAYHVVYIWLAAKGYRGFDFYHLPLFT